MNRIIHFYVKKKKLNIKTMYIFPTSECLCIWLCMCILDTNHSWHLMSTDITCSWYTVCFNSFSPHSNPGELVTTIVPILQITKLKFREAQNLAWVTCQASSWYCGLNLGPLTLNRVEIKGNCRLLVMLSFSSGWI